MTTDFIEKRCYQLKLRDKIGNRFSPLYEKLVSDKYGCDDCIGMKLNCQGYMYAPDELVDIIVKSNLMKKVLLSQ